jgi:hypothetical protein
MTEAKLATWARIEPHAATTDINVGLAAEIADPLWLLARQMQLGEFAGSDGGSPIDVELMASWAPITRYRPGAQSAGEPMQDYDVDHAPLERTVEAEPVVAAIDWRAAAIWGQRLEQAFSASPAIISALRAAFPFSKSAPDNPAEAGSIETRFLAIFGGTTNGHTALEAIGRPEMTPVRAAAPDPEAFDATIAAWAAEMKKTVGGVTQMPPSWQPERLEYAFSIGSPGFGEEQTLVAAEYDGTGLDWYHFDVATSDDRLGAAGTAARDPRSRHFLPRSVSFPGMPADRFWEMEDGLIDLGTLDSGPTDLARMLATEYAVIYSPDWFVVPLEFPLGCLARVEWIAVTDTFGVSTLVGTQETQAQDKGGRMFQLSSAADGAEDGQLADIPYLFVPPAALHGQQSQPLENLLVERDEQANLAWIIEKSILGAAGRPIAIAPGTPPGISFDELPPGAAEPDLAYQVATWVPAGWIPLVQLALDGGEAIAEANAPTILERGLLLETDTYKLRTATGILGGNIERLFEEEVRRDGLRLQMVDQRARWIDGSVHVWRGRQKKAGRGEADAKLYFDFTGERGGIR